VSFPHPEKILKKSSGLLRLGLFRSGKVRGSIKTLISIVIVEKVLTPRVIAINRCVYQRR